MSSDLFKKGSTDSQFNGHFLKLKRYQFPGATLCLLRACEIDVAEMRQHVPEAMSRSGIARWPVECSCRCMLMS